MWSRSRGIKSRYILKNRKKYIGDPTKLVAKSMLERAAFIWAENNPRIKKWGYEIVKIPYICATDKKQHIYIVDMALYWDNGTVELVEIKPSYQVEAPKRRQRTTKKYINEVYEYVKNSSKWKYAKLYAKSKGWKFSIWDQNILKNKGAIII